MINPVVPKSFTSEMKAINNGLFVVWHEYFERFQVMHHDNRTGIVRCIVMVENDDGSFRPCDNRTLDYLRNKVSWELMGSYPRPKDMVNVMRNNRIQREMDKEEERRAYKKMWNKEHRKYWKAAMENLRKGIMHAPTQTKSKIISSPGISPKNSSVETEVNLIT